MVERWHLDLIALGLVCGLVSCLLTARINQRFTGGSQPRDPATATTALVLAALGTLVFGRTGVLPKPLTAAMVLLAMLRAPWTPLPSRRWATPLIGLVTLSLAVVFSGHHVTLWVILLGIANLALVAPTAARTDDDPPADGLLVFGISVALWTATPDTDAMALFMAALAPAALVDLLNRRWNRPDPLALMTVLAAATIEFRGRPAGAVILPVMALAGWAAVTWRDRAWVSLVALSCAASIALFTARTAGISHGVSTAVAWVLPGALAMGVLVLVGARLPAPLRTDPTAGHRRHR